MKREYKYDSIDDVTEKTIINSIKNLESIEDWKNRLILAKKLDIPLFLITWPFDYPHLKHPEIRDPLFFFRIEFDEENNLKFILINRGGTNELQNFIKRYRNGYSFRKVKPLLIAKSHMECYLSGTPNPWPGDLDGVIVEKKGKEVKSLLEFKTHNLGTPIEEEDRGKYSSQDTRRFNVITYLQINIKEKQDSIPNILFIVWSPKRIHRKIKIQIIRNDKIIKTHLINSPIVNNDYQTFFKEIIKLSN